jgi:hypothetical protein
VITKPSVDEKPTGGCITSRPYSGSPTNHFSRSGSYSSSRSRFTGRGLPGLQPPLIYAFESMVLNLKLLLLSSSSPTLSLFSHLFYPNPRSAQLQLLTTERIRNAPVDGREKEHNAEKKESHDNGGEGD